MYLKRILHGKSILVSHFLVKRHFTQTFRTILFYAGAQHNISHIAF